MEIRQIDNNVEIDLGLEFIEFHCADENEARMLREYLLTAWQDGRLIDVTAYSW